MKTVKFYACISRMLGLQNMAKVELYYDKELAEAVKAPSEDIVQVQIKEIKPKRKVK